MKQLITILSILFSFSAIAQTNYLVNSHTPASEFRYTPYKYLGTSSKMIEMSGGEKWAGGFTLANSVGPYRPGYATFNLDGKYENLMFVYGAEVFANLAIQTEPSIFTIHADGRKIFDQKIYNYTIPRRVVLNIKDVKELKFSQVMGEIDVAIGEATLWKTGQTPKESGNIVTKKTKPIELTKELMPYLNNNNIKIVSPTNEIKSLKINGREYKAGLYADMRIAMIGKYYGNAYFNMQKQYTKLSFTVGPIDNANSRRGKGWITVKADNKIVYEHEMSYQDIAQKITLDITGCEQLSFHSEQESNSINAGIVDIIAYPAGTEPASVREPASVEVAPADPRLKSLPDVCKLISNIPPYVGGSAADKQIFDGKSDYITFTMGGEKFSEGIVLYESADLFDDNLSSYAIFDVGNEFDYVSFTVGYIPKSGAMNNDVLRVYADDKLVLRAPLYATYPNKKYVVPINKCRKLRIENRGMGRLSVAGFGVGDIVVYRGEPVENDLFARTKPETPNNIDLIDLGAPYIHYVSPMKDDKEKTFYDGSTLKNYFELNGQRIHKGFLLQTSTHFSLDFGAFYQDDDPESDSVGEGGGTGAAIAGATAVGAAFVATGVSIGGAMVGATLVGVASLMALAAGGEAVENSMAAFNTYGEYNSVTFTVACYQPNSKAEDYKETLLIGADQQVVAKLTVYETMEPQTVTVPLDGCEQLMFWLCNTGGWSGKYLFYDIKLSKENKAKDIPLAARLSEAVITQPANTKIAMTSTWERPASSTEKSVDEYLRDVSNLYVGTKELIAKIDPEYEIYTYYLETSSGQICKAVKLKNKRGTNYVNIYQKHKYHSEQLKRLTESKNTLTELAIKQVSASVGLVNLGLKAIAYGKLIKATGGVVKECHELIDIMYQDQLQNFYYLDRLLRNPLNVDGKVSNEITIICPLSEGEVPPSKELQMVEYFNL